MAQGVTTKRVGQACIHTLRWTVVMLRNGRLPAGAGALALAAVLTYVVTDARFSVDTRRRHRRGGAARFDRCGGVGRAR